MASANGMQAKLQSALNELFVAAVGPVVAQSLVEYGVSVDVTPQDSYFMKPLTRAIVSKTFRWIDFFESVFGLVNKG